MSDVFEKIKELKEALREINGGDLPVDSKVLDNKTLSANYFVDYRLLPPSIDASDVTVELNEGEKPRADELAVAPTVPMERFTKPHPDKYEENKQTFDAYSKGVLQAVWVIASNSQGGYGAAIGNILTLNRAFSFLDTTWVPKIVDERTYRVGKALQKFLADVLQEEIIKTVPEKFPPVVGIAVREPATEQLTYMQSILNQRLERYEAHSPQKVEEITEIISLRDNRKKSIEQEEKEFRKNDSQIRSRLNEEVLRLQDSNSPQALKEIIAGLTQNLEALKKARQEFASVLEEWNNENQGKFNLNGMERSLPDSIKTPSAIRTLIYPNSVSVNTATAEWLQLFNTRDQISSYIENIKISLAKTFRDINNTTISASGIVIENFERQKIKAEQQFLDKVVPIFTEQLQPAITRATTLGNQPHFYNPEQIPSDAATCQTTLKELNAYLDRYQKEAALAYNNFEANNPPEKEWESLDKKAYSMAIKVAKKDVLQKQEQKIAEIKDYIKEVQEELQSLSSEFRKQELAKLGSNVELLFKGKREADRQQVQAAAQRARFIDDQYKPALQKITDNYNSQLKVIDQKFDELAQERKNFLLEAKEALLQYKKILEEHRGIYIPEQIPQQQLKTYLEINNEDQIQWIDDLYSQSKAASGVRGTFTLLSNYVSHYTTLMRPSDFDMDLNEVLEGMESKLKHIDQELGVDIRGPAVQPLSQNMAKDNLYALREKYDSSPEIALLRKEKAQETAKWEEKKEPYEQELLLAKFHQELATIAHEHTLIEHQILALDCKLNDILDEDNKTLNKVTEQLTKLNGEDALEFWHRVESDVAAIDIVRAFNTPKGHRELSAPDAMKKIDDSLLMKEKSWGPEGAIEEIAAQITDIPVELQQLKEKELSHFNELKAQKVKLNAKPQMAVEKIATRKSVIESLVKIAGIQQQITGLQNQPVENNEEKEALLQEMHHAEAELADSLSHFDAGASPDIRTKLTATTRMLSELSEAKTKLQIDLLTSLESESKVLLEVASQQVSSASLKTREEIANSIDSFAEKAKNILKLGSQNQNETVQKELSAIRATIEELQEVQATIPVLNQLDAIHNSYENLVKKADELTSSDSKIIPYLGDSKLLPYLALSKKAKELAAAIKPIRELEGHILISDKLKLIEETKQKLEPIEEKCETIRRDEKQSLQILIDIAAAYEALNAKRQYLRTGLHQFYQKDKARLYKDASELNELWEEIESHFDKSYFGTQEFELLDAIKKNESMWILLVETNKPQSIDSLFKDEDKVEFTRARISLEEEFFGKATPPMGGLFGQYLEERAKTYWFKDAVSSFAALVFQCFNYKTDAQERQEYLQDLRDIFKAYKENPAPDLYEALVDKIDEGERFKPRSKEKNTHEKTLQSHLSKFKQEVKNIQEQNTNLAEDREGLRVGL